MMLRIANGSLHALHLLVISFSLTGWAFAQTRAPHLVLSGITLFSWFVLGPILGRTGFCFLTGIQHCIWKRNGRSERPSYMSYLFKRLTGRAPGSPGAPSVRAIELVTQIVFYSCTLMSILLV